MSEVSGSVLARVSLFSELDDGYRQRLAECLRARRYARGQIIFAEGDPGASLCIVESGTVRVVTSSPEGKELVLNTFGPGDVFGELALLDGEPRSADAVAQEPCRLYHLPREDFVQFLEANPRAAISLLALLSRKLRYTTHQVQDVAFLDVPARLARALLELNDLAAPTDAAASPARLRVTQSELAARIGATRESVNKCLGHFAGQGLIACERNQITVLQPAGLKRRIY
jgi:CRP/FNR family cyclic AMP-dependent transcriptional regulator